jgi:hypothetical protein
MAVEKALNPAPASTEEVEVTVVNPEAVAVETDDETVVLEFGGEMEGPAFNENLADHISGSDLQNVSSELMGAVETDRGSRKDWEQTYVRGLELLGLQIEERSTPWPGACGVFHPMLSEAVIRFQAQSIMETFPAKGPVKTQILGKLTEEKEKQAIRVADEMNYQVTEVMTEYRDPNTRACCSPFLLQGLHLKKFITISTWKDVRPCSCLRKTLWFLTARPIWNRVRAIPTL